MGGYVSDIPVGVGGYGGVWGMLNDKILRVMEILASEEVVLIVSKQGLSMV
jgi:hypothetical protein